MLYLRAERGLCDPKKSDTRSRSEARHQLNKCFLFFSVFFLIAFRTQVKLWAAISQLKAASKFAILCNSLSLKWRVEHWGIESDDVYSMIVSAFNMSAASQLVCDRDMKRSDRVAHGYVSASLPPSLHFHHVYGSGVSNWGASKWTVFKWGASLSSPWIRSSREGRAHRIAEWFNSCVHDISSLAALAIVKRLRLEQILELWNYCSVTGYDVLPLRNKWALTKMVNVWNMFKNVPGKILHTFWRLGEASLMHFCL